MSAAQSMRCDIAVVGGGPAGIAAAARASEQGAKVVIIDAEARPGGQIWRHRDPESLPRAARRWMARLRRTDARWLLRSTVVDGDIDRGLTIIGPGSTMRLHASRVIIATGARELFLPFPGWTLPNVMGVGGAQAMLKAGLDVEEKRVIVAGSGPLLLPVAAAMARAGARVVGVVEQVPFPRLGAFALSLWSRPEKLLQAARYRSAIPLNVHHPGAWIERADGARCVEAVTLTTGRHRWVERCDLLCCSYGLVPSTELAQLFGCRIANRRVVVDTLQQTTVAGVYSAGESTGIAGDDAAVAEGEVAGLASAATIAAPPIPRTLRRRQRRGQRFSLRLSETFHLRDELLHLATPDTIVCRCEDVRLRQLDSRWTGRQAKLYTRAGMGPCQGAVCGPAIEHLFKWPAGSTRPPLFAPPLAAWMPAEGESEALPAW